MPKGGNFKLPLTGWTLDTVRQMIKEATPFQDNTMGLQNTDTPHMDTSLRGEKTFAFASEDQSKHLQKVDPFLNKREEFEKGRLLLNQEWCEKFHFYQTHKKFPNADELADTCWQAERLTAIEGRLYHRNLTLGVSASLLALCQEARQEFLKNGGITLEAKVIIKTANITENQAAQVEQHILFHKGKIGEDPTAIKIQKITEAVTIHAETRDYSKVLNDASSLSSQYTHLMEQQEILADRTKHRSIEGCKETSGFLANKDDKVASLNLQISRTLKFGKDSQQREIDRRRGMSI